MANHIELKNYHFTPGQIFCHDVHGHELSGDVAKSYRTTQSSMTVLDSDIGEQLYLILMQSLHESDSDHRQSFALANKTAYVVSTQNLGNDYDEIVTFLYKYDFSWYMMTAFHVNRSKDFV